MKIAVIGSGSWGTAMAVLLAKKDYNIYLWSWQQEETDRLNKDRENKEFLPGINLPENITCSHDIKLCVDGADLRSQLRQAALQLYVLLCWAQLLL